MYNNKYISPSIQMVGLTEKFLPTIMHCVDFRTKALASYQLLTGKSASLNSAMHYRKFAMLYRKCAMFYKSFPPLLIGMLAIHFCYWHIQKTKT